MYLRLICLCFSVFLLLSCGEKQENNGQGPIVVITSPDSPPFEFKDTATGGDQVIGFDIDVAKKLGEHLGREVKIVEAEFSSLIPALQSGRADMAMAYISPSEERKKSVDFSDPYYFSKISLLVKKDSDIGSEKDLKGKKLGVQLGSANEMIAQKWEKQDSEIHLASLNKIGDLVQELKNGRIQAILLEDIVGRKIANANPGLKVVVLETLGTPIAIAFPKGSALLQPTNEALKAMKEDIPKIEEKWIHE